MTREIGYYPIRTADGDYIGYYDGHETYPWDALDVKSGDGLSYAEGEVRVLGPRITFPPPDQKPGFYWMRERGTSEWSPGELYDDGSATFQEDAWDSNQLDIGPACTGKPE